MGRQARVRVLVADDHPLYRDGIVRAIKQRPDSTDLLPTITCPTLVIRGEEDALISSAECRAMARAIPGAELVAIPGAGHLPR